MRISPKHVFFATLLGAAVLTGCNTAQVMEVRNAPYGASSVAAPKRLALDDYERAIIRAGAERGWVMQRVAPGHLEASVDVRGKHTAVVDIFFSPDDFSIAYKDSRNLKYDAADDTIHRNYNSWVSLLEQEIQREVQVARAS